MTLEINSNSNKNIKHIKSLKKKKYRDKYNEFIIEGIRIIEHGILNNYNIKSLYYREDIYNDLVNTKIINKLEKKNTPVYKVSNRIFAEIADTENPQGVIAIVEKKHYKVEDILNKENLSLILLDRLQDPGNVGTIIRTADAAGFHGVFYSKGCVDIYNEKTVRSTMGSIFTMPIIKVENLNGFVDKLRSNNINVISTTLDANTYHYEVEYGNKNAIVIGNEGNGICKEIIDKSNVKVKIPMVGSAESLNASVAAGVIIYEILRHNNCSENS